MTQLERAEAVIRQVAAEEICRGPGEEICKRRELPPTQWCGVCKAKEYAAALDEAVGNPWAPNKDFPGKPVERRLCSGGQCKLGEGHDGDHIVNLRRRCICPNGTRTAIAHVNGCPAGGG